VAAPAQRLASFSFKTAVNPGKRRVPIHTVAFFSPTAARDPHVKASLLWEGHLAAALRSINGTCGTGKKIDYSWMDAPDPDLPPVVYSANFSQYAYTHPTGLRSAIRVARVAVEMYRVEQVKCLLLSSQLQMLNSV
jgi:hypothetical protein